METVHELVKKAMEHKASQLVLVPGSVPVARTANVIISIGVNLIAPEDTDEWTKQIAPPRYQQMFAEHGAVIFGSSNFAGRVQILRANAGAITILISLNYGLVALAELGLEKPELTKLLEQTGLLLITGQAGSGKTTTMAAIIDWLNRFSGKRLVIETIENPIEIRHKPLNAIVIQRELHVDTPSFAYATRNALEARIDVLSIGQIRDLEGLEATLFAAQKGYLVLVCVNAADRLTNDELIGMLANYFPVTQIAYARNALKSVFLGRVATSWPEKPRLIL